MNIIIQIYTFIFSFIYGFIFFYLIDLNKHLTKNNRTIIKYLTNILFMLDMVLIYVIINYKINNGYFHFYFFITLILGYFLANCTQIYVKSTIKKLKIRK